MRKTELLLARLGAIAESLARTEGGLALIGLGSSGAEQARMDDYSDLDFFAIVAPGAKAAYLSDLGWLSSIRPIVYQFQNTVDGYKLLFDDGVFCEFAVFEPQELARIPFAAERVIWQRPGSAALPGLPSQPRRADEHSQGWLLGEALTNLYVGLGRHRRGERLSAARFIQGHAVDRVLELGALLEPAQPADADPFGIERRYEQRFPGTATQLPAFVQGYERNCESALAILEFLEQHFKVSPELARRIRELCAS